MSEYAPIGIFDSGYGGLTVLREIVDRMGAYDYIYLGDNARTPYGSRSFTTVYHYTLQSVRWLFDQGAPLVILACNTASAKALRTIQQQDLPVLDPDKRVLGVIRPTAEIMGSFTQTGSVGILGTKGTVESDSYPLEIAKFFPKLSVFQQACPLWVPLIENNEYQNPGAAYFIEKDIKALLSKSPGMDTILLACTHYPLISDQIRKFLPGSITLVSQGEIVAASLADYLDRHPEMEQKCSRGGEVRFFTTDSVRDFDLHSSHFYGRRVSSRHVDLPERSA